MINNGHNNLLCKYTEQLTAYLYDEINGKEKNSFENHLQNCEICTDELAGFSVLRSAISEWRENDFEFLETPSVILPLANKPDSSKRSWTAAWQSFFIFSPAKTAFSAAFAVLMITIGLFLFVSNSSTQQNDPNIAKLEKAEDKQVKTKIAENEDTQNPIPAPTIVPAAKNTANISKSPTVKNASVPVKTSGQPAIIKNQSTQSIPSSAPRIKSPAKNNAPVLDSDDDEDDDSLRLSDMFDEIGMNTPADRDSEKGANNE